MVQAILSLLLAASMPQGPTHGFGGDAPPAVIWDARLTSSGHGDDTGADVAVHGATAFVVSRTYTDAPGWVVRAHDLATGAILWTTSRKAAGAVPISAISPDGSTLVVAGQVDADAAGALDLLVAGYSAASGAELWSRTHVDPQGGFVEPHGLAFDPASARVSVATRSGELSPAGAMTWTTLSFQASDGALLWTATHALSGVYWPAGIGTSPDGALVHVGGSDRHIGPPGVTLDEFRVNTYDAATGALLYSQVRDMGSQGSWRADALAVHSQTGAVYLTGSGTTGANTVAFDGTGGGVLFATAAGKQNKAALVSSDGLRLVVSGYGAATTALDAATGAVLWTDNFLPGPGAPSAQGVQDLAEVGGLVIAAGGLYPAWPTQSDFHGFARAIDLASGAVAWSEIHPAVLSGSLVRAASGTGGTLVLVGTIDDGIEGNDVLALARAASDGSPVWERLDDFPFDGASRPESVVDVAPDSAGARVLGTLQYHPIGGQSALFEWAFDTFALDAATGAELWRAPADAEGLELRSVSALVLSPSGHRTYAVTEGPYLSNTRVVARHSSDGSLVWSLTLGSTAGTLVRAALSPDGARLYVARSVATTQDVDLEVIALDAASGATVWVSTWTTPAVAASSEVIRGLAVDPAGQGVVALVEAFLGGAPSLSTMLRIEEPAGSISWAHPDPAASGVDLALSPDGSLAASVSYGQFGLDQVALVVRDAASGALLASSSGSLAGTMNTVPIGIAFHPDGGRLFLGGYWTVTSIGQAAGSFAASFELSTGAMWLSKSPAPTLYANDLALSPDGALLFLLGTTCDATPDCDWLSLELRASTGSVIGNATVEGGAQWNPALPFLEQARAGAFSADGERLFAAGEVFQNAFDADGLVVAYDLPHLVASPAAVSLAAGGKQDLLLRATEAHAAEVHLVLGSLSGTNPGLVLPGGQTLPLVVDSYFSLSLTQANSPPFSGTFAVLDAFGTGAAAIAIPVGSPPSLAGTTAYHAFVTVDPITGEVGKVSEPRALTLLP